MKMKLNFESNLDFQLEAINAISDIFEGQTTAVSDFTITSQKGWQIAINETDLGIGNKLIIDEDTIDENVKMIQLRNGLKASGKIKKNKLDFTIEMETGTGKTYVYLRTIFELSKKYGFKKYIIVVPSVAIKEGVKKSIKIMEDHFKLLYGNTPFKFDEYSSGNVELIRSFATSDVISILVLTIQAMNKNTNVINNEHERTNGLKPLDFLKDTNPIVIIDEPQSVVSTSRGKETIERLNSMCTIGYSATLKEKNNLMYKLDSIDAYERKLVKQIEVANISARDHNNNAYMKLVSVENGKSPIIAKIEIDKKIGNKIKREIITCKKSDDLYEMSGNREQYIGYIVSEIYTEPDKEYVSFTCRESIRIGEVFGGFEDDVIKRSQIKKTIEEHMEKELELTNKGIKVLSLFFIDKVSNYREYGASRETKNGKYADWFEEEFKKLASSNKYKKLYEGENLDELAKIVHDGYFAQDKNKCYKDSRQDKEGSIRANKDDESAFKLIMQDKEKLLSFSCKLKFIFSHSALKEGWDNPNVFQICTLNETKSVMKKRQEIGRGLRICVNQEGDRVAGFNINTLTIMANESYEEFAKSLQKEIEEDEGIVFGVVKKHTFANINIVDNNGDMQYLGYEVSEKLWNHFETNEYIDENGKVSDKLKNDIKNNKVDLPPECKNIEDKIVATLRKLSGNLNIKDANDKKKVKLNKIRFLSEEFKELWDRIKYKTTFTVKFDSDELIAECVDVIKKKVKINKAKLIYTKAGVEISAGGAEAKEVIRESMYEDNEYYQLPDVITYLQNETNLTRNSIYEILTQSNKLDDFKKNPQKFVDEVSVIINRKIKQFTLKGVQYNKIGDWEIFESTLFEKDDDIFGYISKNLVKSDKSIYDYILCDSNVEADFATSLENNNSVKIYTKLPNWFVIDTLIGKYTPDWAVLIDKHGEEKLYFVVETKGSLLDEDLRQRELMKIECGHKHFEALGNDVNFKKASKFEEFIESV
jgi:type III restriction enzyme